MSANTNPPTPPLDGQEDYTPFGKEWETEMNKFSKKDLIVLIKQLNTFQSAALTQANDRVKELEAKNEELKQQINLLIGDKKNVIG